MNKISLLKIVIGSIPILLIAIYLITITNNASQNAKQFYEQSFSSIIISSSTYQGKATEFHLANGLKIYFWLSEHNILQIEDSVEKEANTYSYKVYRKGIDGQYHFLAKYYYEKSL